MKKKIVEKQPKKECFQWVMKEIAKRARARESEREKETEKIGCADMAIIVRNGSYHWFLLC